MPVTAALITVGGGLLQGIIGGSQQKKANKQLKKLFKQRKPFETPKEVFDILNSSEYNAQSGYGSKTLDYLTNQAERGFASSTGAALRLGADPNVIAGLDDQYLQDIMKIGSNNALLQLQNFDKYLNAKQLVAANKEAEWQSKEDILKDQMAMYGLKAQAGAANVNSGLNVITQGGSNLAAALLYGNNNNNNNPAPITTSLPPPPSGSNSGSYGNLTPSQIQQLQQILNNP